MAKAKSQKSSPKKSVKKGVKKSANKTAKKVKAPKAKATKGSKQASVKSKLKKGAAKAKVKPFVKKAIKKASPKKTAKNSKKVAPAKAKKSAKGVVATKVKKTANSTTSKSVQNIYREVLSPLDDRLLVKLSGVEKKTPGGLFIPDTVSDTSGNLQGIVVAVGRGHLTKKGKVKHMDVSLGDQVVFTQYAGSKVQIQNEEFVILRESDVLGIIQK
ncbi:MAG: co-chaperone GroES [Bdellovibrionia bacterium]